MAPSTLLTSRRSQADFIARLVFFAAAPFAIVLLAVIFPVTAALVNIGIALALFLAGEAFQERVSTSRIGQRLFKRQLSFALYYQLRPPRPFAYYALYPLLMPYWLINREARREFWLFKGYTLGSLVILCISVIYQYAVYWAPDLNLWDYARVVGITLAAEFLLVLWLLMPIATTTIGFFGTKRRGRLYALLLVGVVSTGFAVTRLVMRREPIVSYATRERISSRTAKLPERAHEVQVLALRAAWSAVTHTPDALAEDGKVDGPPLEQARTALAAFYKKDEAYAFNVWASPRQDPKILVLYFESYRGRPPIWYAMNVDGEEINDSSKLPKGAFAAMRRAVK